MNVLSAIETAMDMEDTCGGDEYCGSLDCISCKRVAFVFLELKKAREAVAEYIAANDEYDAAWKAYHDAGSDGGLANYPRVKAATARRDAAHARMKGETK